MHRAFIVNTEHITEIHPWFNSTYNLILKDGSKIPVSRTYAKDLKSCFILYEAAFAFQQPFLAFQNEYSAVCYESALKAISLYNGPNKEKEVKKMSAKKVYGFLTQAFIFAVIMLISNGIAAIVPIPIPASVVGLVLLFVLLCLKVIKLEQVETLGTSLTSLIGFLFVPSGISVMNSLGVMQQYGVQIALVILLATIILLGATGLFLS